MTIEPYHAGRIAELGELAYPTRFHGAIIANTHPDDDRFLAENRPAVPVVLIGRRIPGYSAVIYECGSAATRAAEVLAAAGSPCRPGG